MPYRFGAAALLLAVVAPLLQSASIFGNTPALPLQGVKGGTIPKDARSQIRGVVLDERADSPTHVCFRWAQQSALVNGTLYLYGGEATTQAEQTENTWNNNFLTLDLTKTWQIGSPPLVGLPQPSGPPSVSLGYLWNSHESLFQYGGEFSWKPPVEPTAFSLWEYDIRGQSWIQHSDPVTSSGQSSLGDSVPVQRAAEGAGANVPSLGRGFYFGGHLDGFTTEGWSQSIPRLYLQSLLEFTFPGFTNDQVDTLSNGQDAGSSGVYRNVTQGGLQADAGFTARADGLLLYVPGFGKEGILLALAGGTNETFTEMNNINVYDIATSSWYTQSTSGPTPDIRVNPCSVVAAAPDGSSYNIYMFGGQNLIPFGNQTQFQDMWILTVPAFTWIQVDQSDQSIPYGRSGATCNMWDGQMVMVGGFVGDALTCESPGIYVFDLSNLQWVQQFTALSPGSDDSSSTNKAAGSGSTSTGSNNPFNQQPAQLANSTSPGGLEGSFGYTVPDVVVSVIGGDKNGGATITAPVVSATAGPMKTGSPVTYTVTGANGATITETALSGPDNSAPSSSGKGGPNIAAIVVGVVCGILFVVICYLLFCLYVYRKRLQLYKRHVEMAQRQARGEKGPTIPGLEPTISNTNTKSSTDRRTDASNLLLKTTDSGSQSASHSDSHTPSGGPIGSNGYESLRRSSEQSSSEDLLSGQEPTFVGVMLNPRRSLRVINRD